MNSGDLIVVTSKQETTHLALAYTSQIFTLCGIVDGSGDLTPTTHVVDCRRCRTAGAEQQRSLLRAISDLRGRLEFETARFDHLSEAMGPT